MLQSSGLPALVWFHTHPAKSVLPGNPVLAPVFLPARWWARSCVSCMTAASVASQDLESSSIARPGTLLNGDDLGAAAPLKVAFEHPALDQVDLDGAGAAVGHRRVADLAVAPVGQTFTQAGRVGRQLPPVQGMVGTMPWAWCP